MMVGTVLMSSFLLHLLPGILLSQRPFSFRVFIPSGALLYYSIVSYLVPGIVAGLAGGSCLLRLSDMSPEFSGHFLSFWY